jgi:hypothetical protein
MVRTSMFGGVSYWLVNESSSAVDFEEEFVSSLNVQNLSCVLVDGQVESLLLSNVERPHDRDVFFIFAFSQAYFTVLPNSRKK